MSFERKFFLVFFVSCSLAVAYVSQLRAAEKNESKRFLSAFVVGQRVIVTDTNNGCVVKIVSSVVGAQKVIEVGDDYITISTDNRMLVVRKIPVYSIKYIEYTNL